MRHQKSRDHKYQQPEGHVEDTLKGNRGAKGRWLKPSTKIVCFQNEEKLSKLFQKLKSQQDFVYSSRQIVLLMINSASYPHGERVLVC